MDYVIGNSQSIINQLKNDEFVSEKKTILIYNYVKLKKYVKKK